MKKVVLILLLFCAKTVSAQHFNFGLSLGDLGYRFSSVDAPDYNHSALAGGFCAQYILRDSSFGIEGNLLLYASPPVLGSTTGAFAPYFFVNVAPYNPISIEIKLGLLASRNFATYTPPLYDVGPAFGFYFYFVLPHTPEMGVDLTLFLGQEYYTLYEPGPIGATPNPAYPSQLKTVNLSFKIMVP